MIRRLRIKFVCINMAIVTAMLLVIFGLVFHFTRENLQRQSVRAMEFAAENLFLPGRPGSGPDKVSLPGFVVEIGPAGETAVRSNGYFDLSDESLLRELIRLVEDRKDRIGNLLAYKLRFFASPTPEGERIVFVDISSEMETMKGLLKTCILIGLLSLAVFFCISMLLARWAVKPVEKAWDQQRQFVADASHELKTPLTVIMTNAELLQSADYPEQEKGRFAQSILTMSHQMRGLVESLLELARVDNGSAKMEFSALDFSGLTEDTLMLFEPVYFERGLQLESDVEGPLQIRGSRAHLQQVLEILLDNGMKYSTENGTVTVTLRRQGGHCLLAVASPGEAISKTDLKNIFKRFYRIDKARSMNHSYGLGLSIAQSILTEHGGKIWAESSGGINTFFVQLNLLT